MLQWQYFAHVIMEGGGELREGFGPNVADADISAIRNLNGLANELMKPNGTLTNPGNLNVTGSISTNGKTNLPTHWVNCLRTSSIYGSGTFGWGDDNAIPQAKINSDGGASFANGKVVINSDGSVSFANGNVVIDPNGNVFLSKKLTVNGSIITKTTIDTPSISNYETPLDPSTINKVTDMVGGRNLTQAILSLNKGFTK